MPRPERPNPKELPEALTKRYTIVEKIGSGAMGVVFLARDNVLDILVAIKMMHRDADASSVVRFQNEAIAAGKLRHVNIAQVLDFGNADGIVYMVMEYAQGESLSAVLDKHGKLPAADALELFLDIANGLAYAHANNVIHRDLKPSNVILTIAADGTSQCKIVDFGIAKLQATDLHITGTGAYLGSPAYVSPEQARDLPVDGRTDIYSLGCLMYEALVGHPPFQTETAIETINLKLTTPAPSLADNDFDNSFQPELIKLVDTCLQTDPQDRFESMQKVHDAIEKLLLDEQRMSSDAVKAQKSNETKHSEPPHVPSFASIAIRNKRVISALSVLAALSLAFLVWPKGFLATINLAHDQEKEATASRKEADSENFKNKILPGLPDDPEALRQTTEYVPYEIDKINPAVVIVRRLAQDKDFEMLREVRPIQYVHVQAHEISEKAFESIKDLPIEFLSLEHTEAEGGCLRSIAKMPKLNWLVLHNNPSISEDSLQYLYPLANRLEVIEVRSANLTDKTADYVSRFPQLVNVSIGNSRMITDRSAATLLKLTQLASISLPYTGVSARGVQLIASKSNLLLLNISGTRLDDTAAVALGHSHLQTLICFDCEPTPQEIAYITEARQISDLEIDASRFDHDSLRLIAKMPALHNLVLQHMRRNLDLSPLIESKIGNLSIKESDVRESELTPILKLSTLQSVYIDECKNLSDSFARDLSNQYKRLWKRPLKVDIHEKGLREVI